MLGLSGALAIIAIWVTSGVVACEFRDDKRVLAGCLVAAVIATGMIVAK